MAEFPSTTPQPYQQNPNSINRVGRKELLPAAVEPRNLSFDIISRADQSRVGPVSTPTGSGFYIVTIVKAKANPNVPLGSLGIAINWYVNSIDPVNLLNPVSTGYTMYPPSMVPTGTNSAGTDPLNPDYSDGNNLVFRSGFLNNSGSDQTIWALIDIRFLMALGGGGGS